MKLSQHVAHSLREIRKSRYMSQSDVARALRVTVNTVSRWETGTYSISLDDLAGLADFFSVPVSDLLPPEKPAATMDEAVAMLDKTLALIKRLQKGEINE